MTVLATDGQTERTTTYSGYRLGGPSKVVDPFGAITTYEYDAAGNVRCVTNAVGEKTYYSYTNGHDYTYGDRTRGLYTSTAKGLLLETWTYRPSDAYQWTKVVIQKNVYYDDGASPWRMNLLKETTDAAGMTIRYEYSADMLTQSVYREWTDHADEEQSLRVSTTEYDALGRAKPTTDAYGRQVRYFYDLAGQTSAVIDQFGGVTVNSYDVRGNLVRTIGPDGVEYRWEYDELGRITASSWGFAGDSDVHV